MKKTIQKSQLNNANKKAAKTKIKAQKLASAQ